MRLIAIFISVITALYLAYAFIVAQQARQVTAQVITAPKQVIPAYISNTPLLVEQVWQQLKTDRIKVKQPVEKVEKNALKEKDVFSIGNNNYALYGIFNAKRENDSVEHGSHANHAFILIKGLSKEGKLTGTGLQKIMQGSELSQGVFLVAVTSNSISFKQADELIKFKLFDIKGR